jgi:DNA-directed RNA polymerase specialized sigma subunit
MEYIKYPQIEELLKKYPSLKALLNNLQIELEKLWRYRRNSEISEEDILYSLAIGNRTLSDMPHVASHSPGDKELGIIEQKDRIINKEYVFALIADINEIGEVVEKITTSLRSLPADRQKILTLFYCEGKTWKDIANEMKIGRDTAKENRKEAISQIQTILRVTWEQYEYCLSKVK